MITTKRQGFNDHATAVQREASRRTEEHFYNQRAFWDEIELVNPTAYKLAWQRNFRAFRRDVVREGL